MQDGTFDSKILFNVKMRISYLLAATISLFILVEIFAQLDVSTIGEVIKDTIFDILNIKILLYMLYFVRNKHMNEVQKKV